MQKIKSSILDKMISENITSTEINLLVYISHYQFDRGNVMGVYYRDVCTGIGVSFQAFYDALRGLQSKGFIMAEKGSYYDWNILILNNDFSCVESNIEGYINTGNDLFHSKEFYALKAKEKLLAMHMLKVCGSNGGSYNIGAKKIYKVYGKMLGVTKRAIQNYIKTLKHFFIIGVKDGKYWITARKKVFKEKTPTDRKLLTSVIATAAFRRNRAKATETVYNDIVDLIAQYASEHSNKIYECFSKAFHNSIYKKNEHRNNPYKWDRTVSSPQFVHKLLREELEIAF